MTALSNDWAEAKERKTSWMENQYHRHPNLLAYYKNCDDDGMLRALVYGPEVPEAWFRPLEKLFEKLSEIRDLRIVQVKEKFWSLRVYYEYRGEPTLPVENGWITAIDRIDGLIKECEEECEKLIAQGDEKDGKDE